MDKEIYSTFGYKTMFCKDSCFVSKNEAKRYISKLLRNRGLLVCGRLRQDMNRSHFKIRQVYRHRLVPNVYTLDKKEAMS